MGRMLEAAWGQRSHEIPGQDSTQPAQDTKCLNLSEESQFRAAEEDKLGKVEVFSGGGASWFQFLVLFPDLSFVI